MQFLTNWFGLRTLYVDQHVGRRVSELRAGRTLSLADVATAIGVSIESVRRIEAGKVRLKPAQIFALATALEVTVASFFHDPAAEQLT